MMLRALLQDLCGLREVEVFTSRDPRLPPIDGIETITPAPGEDPLAFYARGLAAADAAWPTAPESGGTLERLAEATIASGRTLLGSRPAAVRLAASKRATALALEQAGVAAVPTYRAGDLSRPMPGRWVTKPDDGAGCENMRLLPDWAAARESLATDPGRLVAQPWIEGEPMSLSLICHGGTARLICCNRQQIGIRNGLLSLERIVVNAIPDSDGVLAALARQIAAAIPDLWGYVGVDFIATGNGPIVLEINPRLTTSCCGIRQALGVNIAALVLGLPTSRDRAGGFASPGSGSTVEISFESDHA